MPAWNTLRVSNFDIILQGWWVEVLLWILAIEHVWMLLELHMYPYDVVIFLYIHTDATYVFYTTMNICLVYILTYFCVVL